MIVGSKYFWKKALEAAAKHVASGSFDGPLSPALCTVKLFKTNTNLDPDTVIGDLTEADFSGYAAVTPPVFLTKYQLPDGSWALQTDLIQFLQTAATITNTVFGWWLETSADGGQLLLAESFAEPQLMFAADQAIMLSIRVQMGDPDNKLGVGELG